MGKVKYLIADMISLWNVDLLYDYYGIASTLEGIFIKLEEEER